jgi:hypothetical protein
MGRDWNWNCVVVDQVPYDDYARVLPRRQKRAKGDVL